MKFKVQSSKPVQPKAETFDVSLENQSSENPKFKIQNSKSNDLLPEVEAAYNLTDYLIEELTGKY